MIDYKEYWIWLARSESSSREERLAAERDASIHADVARVLGTSADDAVELVTNLAAVPELWTVWHTETLVYGLVTDAVGTYGADILLRICDHGSDRAVAIVDAYRRSGQQENAGSA